MKLEQLLEQAGRIVPGPELNAVLYEIREGFEGAVGYEMVLDGRSIDDLLHVELPRLTEHLFAKRVPMLGAPHLVLTCWYEGRAHIFAGDVFFEAIADLLGVSLDELRARIAVWRGEVGLPPDPWMRPHEGPPKKRGETSLALLPPPEE